MRSTFIALLTLAAALPGSAQEGFRDRDMRTRIRWYPSVESVGGGAGMDELERRRLRAFGQEPSEKKYIFVYIRPITEDKEPNEFSQFADALNASREAWGFVKMDFDKENPHQKAWGIKGAPACVGCDLFGNDFFKMGAASTDAIRNILKGTPEAVARYEGRLKSDYTKAMDTLKLDEDRAAKLFVEIVAGGKKGYKEVTESQAKLGELTENALRKGDLASAVSPETGIEYLEDLVKTYKSSAPGVRAEISIAVLDHARGNAQPAIQRLQKIQKYAQKPELDAAAKALEEVSKAGDQRIDAALLLPDKAQAKEAVRKLAKDYAGTEAGRRAADSTR